MNPIQVANEEFEKCKNDIVYFVENHVKIKNRNGVNSIRLKQFQKDMLIKFVKQRFNIVLPARQTWYSTTINLFLTNYIKFNSNKNIVIFEMNHNIGSDKLSSLSFMLESVGVLSALYKNEISTKNKCNVTIMQPKNYKEEMDADLIIWDSMAFYGDLRKIWSELYPKVIESNKTKVIISSIPNGKNYFKDLWENSLKGETIFQPIKVSYYEVPGRDAEWVNNMKENLGEKDFNRQFGLSFED